jgi:cell pole-organizing protein PopZ
MTITNGANHQTVEDLLSSIRSSISEDHVPLRDGPLSRMSSASRREVAIGDDNAEFELPAIFKPGHQAPQSERPNNLFGRLSDALKPSAPPEEDRSRTVIRFAPAAGRMIEPPPAAAPQPQSQPTRNVPPVDPAERAVRENAPVRREMPSFFDTRLNRLGEMTRQANAPKQIEAPKPEPQAVALQPPPLRHPMQQSAEASLAGGLEDAAAQLLRPILKQWLSENMPKIVEKALRSEAGEDFPPPNAGPGGRKHGQ